MAEIICPFKYKHCKCSADVYIKWHDIAVCYGCGETTKKFCYNCGEAYHCGSRPIKNNEPCGNCAQKRKEQETCEKDHSCKGGCGARFCTTNRIPGIVYKNAPDHRPGWKNKKFKNYCNECYAKC